jgi:transposase
MTPADETEFIALWSLGLSQDAIAHRLGIPIGTVKSRAHTLAHAGKLTPRPRGGAYPRQKALAAERGLQDSQMVEELLWLALAIMEESPNEPTG